MRDVAEVLVPAVARLCLLWCGLLVVLALQARRLGIDVRARDAVRLGPDVVRLVVRLVRDPAVPRGTRILLAVLDVYGVHFGSGRGVRRSSVIRRSTA